MTIAMIASTCIHIIWIEDSRGGIILLSLCCERRLTPSMVYITLVSIILCIKCKISFFPMLPWFNEMILKADIGFHGYEITHLPGWPKSLEIDTS